MKSKIAIFIIIVSVILLFGCFYLKNNHTDPFYSNNGGFDSLRFPLVKPYYMVRLDSKYGWQMPMLANPPSESTHYYYNLHDIRKVAVHKGVIMIFTPYVEKNIDISAGQKIYHWFIIIPDLNIEEGFDDQSKFQNYLLKHSIDEPLWLIPKEVYENFIQTGCLDWIPNCIK